MENILSFQKRISDLEAKISEKNEDSTKLLTSLKIIDNNFENFSSKRERFKQSFNKVLQISKMMKPGFEEAILDDDQFKVEYLLSRSEDLMEISHKLDNVSQLSSLCLNKNDQLSDLQNYEKNLNDLKIVQLKQLETTFEVSANLEQLLQTYNNLIAVLDSSFANWNLQISKLEAEKLKNEEM